VVALYRLRRRDPERPRPYRAWGYPWIPGLYFVAIAAIVITMIWGRPLECLVGIGMLIAGLPFYFLFSKGNQSPAG
jgi:APA family basic amino acid/polyamine antiporter